MVRLFRLQKVLKRNRRVTAFLRKAEEGAIGKLIVEAAILLSASRQADGGKVLRAAAQAYKVDTDAIALKVKQEFTAKDKARGEKKPQTVAKPERKRVTVTPNTRDVLAVELAVTCRG
ncbi:hypothetical protein [Edaphobacter modestus]|uniref:hypothetical protein n=1 Tax=Edaphobacter modestus TaxID=388466 RepID=UPI00102AFF8C|nr:hypothetical protein [Edaphobacter modestus]